MRVILAIPAYQCEKQIGRVLQRIPPELWSRLERVWVIENRSQDATLRAAIEAAAALPPSKVEVFENQENVGLGGSHKTAFQEAAKVGATHVAILHGDDQGDPKELIQLLNEAERHGQGTVLGARFMLGSRLEGYSWLRIVGNLALNALYSLFNGRLIFDLGSGVNLFRLADVPPERWAFYSNQFTFNMDLLMDLIRRNVPFRYVPITWSQTDQVGTAKIFRVGWKAFQTLFRWWAHQEKPGPKKKYATQRIFPSNQA